MSDGPLLELRNLSKRFGGLAAVSDLSFSVRPREIVSLIGPNGAGKTTVFNLISGLLRPDNGQVLLRSRDLVGLKPHQIAHCGVGRTFQIMQPFRHMTVLENVLTGLLFGRARVANLKEARARARNLCDEVGIGDKVDRPSDNITVADMKRLEIARALASQPDLLLLDEVMSGLNPKETGEAMKLVLDIRDRMGVTVLLIEHVMKVVMGISDRVVVLHHGQRLAEGTCEDVAGDPRVVDAYLGEQSGEVE